MAAKVKALQQWCKRQCEGYRDVNVTNMTSSWKSGMAFCAIIHRYRPDLIDFDSLSKEDVFDNNKLAFDVAQNELDIAALLDAEDMVAMTVPDKLCIVTYVSQYHNYFRKFEPAGGPGIKAARTPSKRQLPSLTREMPESKKPKELAQNGNAAPQRAGTLGDRCCVCAQKVYIMERHMEGSKLYHRKCLRDLQRSSWSPTQKTFKENPPWMAEKPKRTLDQVDSNPPEKKHDLVKSLFGAPGVYKGFNDQKKEVQPMETERVGHSERPGHLPVLKSTENGTRKTRRDMPPRSMDSKSGTKQKPDENKVLSGLMASLANVRQHNVVPASNSAEKPKPILKPIKDPVEEFPVARNRSASPPKSILKHFDPSSADPVPCPVPSRSSSPPKSILKHTEFSPDTKQEDAPRKSILKRGSFDSESDEWDDSASSSPHRKSILKSKGSDSAGSDPDSGPNSRVTSPSRSILKNSTEWIASPESDDSFRKILKQSPSEHKDFKESPRSILKKNLETPETSPVHMHVRILPHLSPTKEDKRRGILKTRPDDDSDKPVKSTWTPALLKAKTSQGAPAVSASFAAREQNGGDARPAWQIEAEKRKKARGGKYVDPEKKHLIKSEEKQLEVKPPDPVRSKSPVTKKAELNPVKATSDVRPKKKQAPPPPVVDKADWQREAERRTQIRNGHYDDPEKGPLEAPPVNVPCYLGMNMNDIMQKQRNKAHPSPPPPPPAVQHYPIPSGPVDVHSYKVSTPPPSPPTVPPRKSRIIRSPAFRIADEDAPLDQDQNNNPPSPNAKRKILPDVDFSFGSRDFGLLDKLDGVSRTSPEPPSLPSAPPPLPTSQRPEWNHAYGDQQMNIPKRRVNAEARMATLQIVQTLEGLDDQLRGLEEHGRHLEESIRRGSDEAMDEDELMVQWFEVVNQKNELVRKESEMMYRRRQQELEDLHEELEYDLRCLMDMPDNQKTSSDKIREDALLTELLDTVSQRNNIVDSMEEDRIRYMEEDQEIAEMLAQTAQKKKKKKNKKKEKKNKPKSPELSSSPEHEIDEIDCEKEREKERERDKKKRRKDEKKFFTFGAGAS